MYNDLLKKDMTVLKGSYSPAEETDAIEQALCDYFASEAKFEKVWLGREVEMYKNGKNAFIYNVVLKLADKEVNKDSVREEVRKILGNRPFKMYSTDTKVTDNQLKLVYENKEVTSGKKTTAKKVEKK